VVKLIKVIKTKNMDIYKEVKSRFSKYFDRETKLLTKRDICEMLGVSLGKVDIMMSEGLKYIKLNRNVRFRLEDINQYIEENIKK